MTFRRLLAPLLVMGRLLLSLLFSFLMIILLVVVLIGGGVWALLATEPGTQVLADMGMRFAPGELEIDKVEGKVLGDLRVQGIRYAHPSLEAGLDELQLRIDVDTLLQTVGEALAQTWQTQKAAPDSAIWTLQEGVVASALSTIVLRVPLLQLRSLELRLPGSAEPRPEPAEGPAFSLPERLELPLPLRIELDQASIQGLSLLLPGQEQALVFDFIELSGKARSQQLDVQKLALQAEDLQLQARGVVDQNLDLSFEVQAPNLATLGLPLEGSLDASGTLNGQLAEPALRADVRVDELRLEDSLSLASLRLDLDAGIAPERPFRLDLQVQDLRSGDALTLNSLSLQGEGTAARHDLRLALDSSEGRMDMSLSGSLSPSPAWQGRITALQLDQPLAGVWSLQQAAALEIRADSARLQGFCLLQAPTRLCLDTQGTFSGQGSAELQLEGLSLDRLQPWLPDNVQVLGEIGARASVRLDGDLRAEAVVSSPGGEVRMLDLDDEIQSIPYQDVLLEARLNQGRLEADLGMGFMEAGGIQATARIIPRADGERNLDGDVQIQLDELGWLQALVPDIREPSGSLRGVFDIGGTLSQPEIDGMLQLSEGSMHVPEAGISLTDLNLELRNSGLEGLNISGSVVSGPGRMEVQGEARMTPDGKFPVKLRIEGEDFQALHRTDVQALISPRLDVFMVDQRLIITGDLVVPSALVQLAELPPQAVSVSRDEIIVDAGEPEAEDAGGMTTVARIRLQLGDDVRISGYGLEARLSGDVQVAETPGLATRLIGEVHVEEGRFKAYGQDLTVERGIIIFQGPPENPGLNLRAFRDVRAHDIRVGLEISGTLDQPRSELFSIPPVPDGDALALLITGRPLSGVGQGDGGSLVSAIAVFGIERGGFITDQVGAELGLDEFRIDTDSGLEEAALVMGRYLSPELLLRYSVGLFGRSNIVMLQYQLSRSLTLETQSSADAQSMDLLYRLER